jgi:hypothetical protein
MMKNIPLRTRDAPVSSPQPFPADARPCKKPYSLRCDAVAVQRGRGCVTICVWCRRCRHANVDSLKSLVNEKEKKRKTYGQFVELVVNMFDMSMCGMRCCQVHHGGQWSRCRHSHIVM